MKTNMKNKLLAAALVSGTLMGATASAACATYANGVPCSAPFNGAYVTALGGLSQQEYKSTGTGKNSVIQSGVGLGASTIMPFGLYLGAEAQLGLNSQLRDRVGHDVFNNAGTSQQYRVKVTENTTSGTGLFKVGVPFARNTVVYAMAGPKVSGFKVDTKSNGTSRDKDSLNVGLVKGVGVETYVTNNLSAGLSYANTTHQKVKSDNLRQFLTDLGGVNVQVDHKHPKVESNAVMANVSWHF